MNSSGEPLTPDLSASTAPWLGGVRNRSGMPLGITSGLTPTSHMMCFMYRETVVIVATYASRPQLMR